MVWYDTVDSTGIARMAWKYSAVPDFILLHRSRHQKMRTVRVKSLQELIDHEVRVHCYSWQVSTTTMTRYRVCN